jgi:hypothetical protein
MRYATLAAALLLAAATPPLVKLPLLSSSPQRNDPEASPERAAIRSGGTLVMPFPSDSFANSFGINTRFGPPNIYTRQRPIVTRYLIELGFRHIRDGGVADNLETRTFLRDLCTTYGIHSSMGLDDTNTDAEILQYIKDVPCIDMVEGPNELNGRPNWQQRLATFVPHAYGLIRNSPAFTGIPVVGPSITKLEDADALSTTVDLSQSVDFGNKHSYPGQRNIGGSDGTGAKGFGSVHSACPKYAYGSFFFQVCVAQSTTRDKPIWTTETGYSSTPNGAPDPQQHPPYGSVPYDVAAKYLPRLLAYEFANGIARTYIFSLVDGSSGCNGPFNSFGIIEQDCPNTGLSSSLHVKPAFYALKTLMTAVADPGPSFTPTPLSIKVTGGDGKLQTLLLQKRNHQYLLLYWVEASDWDVPSGSYQTVSQERVALSIAGMGSQDTAEDFQIDAQGSLTKLRLVHFIDSIGEVTARDEIGFLKFSVGNNDSAAVSPSGSPH